ncbi:hypothetical protein ACFL7M_03950 [Thermodesulfobacteriota bacterium]
MNAYNYQDDFKVANRIAELVCQSEYSIKSLGRGATSSAWRVSTTSDNLIIRFLPSDTNRPNTYQSEFNILRLLKDKNCPVPEPILSSVELSKTDAFYHGWKMTEIVMESYALALDKQSLFNQTRLAALVLGLHKLSRAVESQAPSEKVNQITRFIADTLEPAF